MTTFNKAAFTIQGTSEVYVTYGKDRIFIARFKHKSPKRCANKFVKFLVENFQVEEYLELNNKGMAPVRILQTKGFVDYNTANTRLKV